MRFSFRVDDVAEEHQVIGIVSEIHQPQVALVIAVISGKSTVVTRACGMAWANASDHAPEPAPTSRILWIWRRSFSGRLETAALDAAKFPGKMLATNLGKNSLPFSPTLTASAERPLFTTSVRSFQASQVSDIAWAIAPI